MVNVPEFPRSLSRERSGAWQIKASVVGAGQDSRGAITRVRTDGGGLWRAEYGSINLRTPDHVRAWRALEVICDAGAGPIVVPMCDKRHMPAPVIDGKVVYGWPIVPYSDAALFSDGAGFSQSVVSAIAYAAASLRATTLQIQVLIGSALRGGERFSINHPKQGWRLYEVGGVEVVSGISVVKFRPPLREAVTAGTTVEFDNPRCTMMLADPDGMKLSMDMRRFANPDASFIEYWFQG